MISERSNGFILKNGYRRGGLISMICLRRNIQRFRIYISELDFIYVVKSHPIGSKLPSYIIQYDPIMKNVEFKSISLKDIARSRINI